MTVATPLIERLECAQADIAAGRLGDAQADIATVIELLPRLGELVERRSERDAPESASTVERDVLDSERDQRTEAER